MQITFTDINIDYKSPFLLSPVKSCQNSLALSPRYIHYAYFTKALDMFKLFQNYEIAIFSRDKCRCSTIRHWSIRVLRICYIYSINYFGRWGGSRYAVKYFIHIICLNVRVTDTTL